MSSSRTGLFIVWRIFQRRSDSLAACFNLEVKYYYSPWEEKSRLHKAWSYVFKTAGTLRDLFSLKPAVVFIQLPPTPVLYIAAAYCALANCKLVADCHNAMIYSRWLNWPFAKQLLRSADALLVHNEDVEEYAKGFHINAITLRDPLPRLTSTVDTSLNSRYDFTRQPYIIVPWSFSPDEPIDELIQAAASMPEINFVMTWFAERLPQEVRNSLPSNLVLTGYLDDTDFNAIFSQATAALVLTTREGTQPSAASEAIVLGVPLIVSDLKTTRRLYQDMPVYIKNTAEGISTGVRTAFEQREKLEKTIESFKSGFSERLEKEIFEVKVSLGLTDHSDSQPDGSTP